MLGARRLGSCDGRRWTERYTARGSHAVIIADPERAVASFVLGAQDGGSMGRAER